MTDHACDDCQENMQQLLDEFDQLEDLLAGKPVQAKKSIDAAQEVAWLENLYKLKDRRKKPKS